MFDAGAGVTVGRGVGVSRTSVGVGVLAAASVSVAAAGEALSPSHAATIPAANTQTSPTQTIRAVGLTIRNLLLYVKYGATNKTRS